MSSWVTEAAQWAAWTQEQAIAAPSDKLDAFDAEVARRLESSGFGANLEETAVTNLQPESAPLPEDSAATLIRRVPEMHANAEEFSDAAETMVHGRVNPELEVSLEAPESGLEVGLDTATAGTADGSDDPTVVSPRLPAEDPVDGLVLPSLTTMPETQPDSAVPEPVEGATVVAMNPLARADRTVIAPAPTGPDPVTPPVAPPSVEKTQPLPPMEGAPQASASAPHEAVPADPEPEPARTGGTLPPTADSEPAEAGQAMSSGVFRAFDIHDDDDEPDLAPARQKVVIGAPQPAPEDDTSELDAEDLDAEDLVEDAEVEVEPDPEPEAPRKDIPPPPKDGGKPPPPKDAPKPPPAPPVRAGLPELPELPELPDPPAPKQPPVEETPEPPAAATPSAPVAAATPKTAGWPEEVFDEHCAAMTRPNHAKLAKAEVEFFIQSTGIQPGARVLDVGCGDGAHTLALAQRGFGVTGLDISPAQIARAERAKEALGVNAAFVKADMRDMPGGGPFDAILCVGTTFGYYDDEENRAVLRSLAAMLTPGGRLLLHVFNRDHIIGRLPSRAWWQGHGCLVLDEARMNFFTNRLAVHRTLVFEDGRQFEHRIKIRGYNAHELGRMCVDASLRVIEISGSRTTRGRFYGASSPDIWLLVEPKT